MGSRSVCCLENSRQYLVILVRDRRLQVVVNHHEKQEPSAYRIQAIRGNNSPILESTHLLLPDKNEYTQTIGLYFKKMYIFTPTIRRINMKLLMTDRSLDIPFVEDKENHYVDLSRLKIANCVGCFGCWVKTPGKCVIRDDAPRVYPLIARSDKVLYVSRLYYGGYDTPMKRILERAIPVQKAFIRLHENETHHVQREVHPKQAVIIAYGEISEKEREIFRRLIEHNAKNQNFSQWKIIFAAEKELQEAVNKEWALWES